MQYAILQYCNIKFLTLCLVGSGKIANFTPENKHFRFMLFQKNILRKYLALLPASSQSSRKQRTKSFKFFA